MSRARTSPTARTRSPRDEMKGRSVADEGLSVDVDELGKQFLADATVQTNLESDSERDTLEITGAAPSDDALASPSFDVDEPIWEETVDLTLQESEDVDAGTRASARVADEDDPLEERPGVDESGPRRLDLGANVVTEGSLFDDEGDELGEVREPDLYTEDRPHHHDSRRSPPR